jgi:hypothetical protein
MKLKNIKNKIDTYFENNTPQEIIENLKAYGCVFEDVLDE